MKDLSWKWLAGFIDADGSFTIGRRIRHRTDGSINLTFHPVINIRQKNTDAGMELLERILAFVNCGRLYTANRNDGTSNITWQTTSIQEVLDVGASVYPELQFKQEQAEKAIRCAYIIANAVDGYNHDPEKLWELYTLYRDINPEGNWADRKMVLTLEEVNDIASMNGKRRLSKPMMATDVVQSLPEDVLKRIAK